MNSTPLRVAMSAAFLIVACLFSVDSVQAQSRSLRVTVPFDFYVGETMLPAGDYEVAPFVNNLVTVQDPARHMVATIPTIPVSKVFGEIVPPKLIFTQYGQDHFLSQMWWGSRSVGSMSILSKRETELAKTFQPIRIEASVRR
jgi:hypothetical protein